ncbi:hypothetical protein HH110_06125 [Stenotrophomonas sp. SAM-B]|uniref:hypothetical protein n=1 Tax=Stenotrophomonas sp. SAM-B TaxID=2729141 RepID=UPI00159FBFBB|nr:hypothetical protein [Stenotrophomonas sp. SAM-B]NWF32620.1 hypothetical protein [Stenotrophomonas sp. SAM-B]
MISLNRFAMLTSAAFLPWAFPSAAENNGSMAMQNSSEVSPEDLAMLGMRLILQLDDESFIKFHAVTTGSTEEDVRSNYIGETREGLDYAIAQAVEDAHGGHALYQVMADAQRRINCAPVLPSQPVERNQDGIESVSVRIRCMIPEIRHIEDGTLADITEGELVPDTNRSWKSYLEDLRGPANIPIYFTWTLLRDPSTGVPGWRPYPFVFEANFMAASLASSPRSLPGGTAKYINSFADGVDEEDADQQGAGKE